ncbi:MAG: metallophosphoesterase family protein [Chloroflexi bacterium]|nr:metallophosphoesterase family protein [Chloroflexota bacterium]
MRIAVLTDVHANLTALRAVLADIRAREPFQLVVSAGDQLCGGPRPLETWDELQAAGATMLKGDTERDLEIGSFKSVPGRGLRRDLILAVFDWTMKRVPEDLRARAASLPRRLRLQVDDGPELLLAHANGVNLHEFIWADTPAVELERLIGPNPPALMVVGHIHAPLELEYKATTILRPGSVGLKYEPQWAGVAHWAEVWWDSERAAWAFRVHQVKWDHRLEIEAGRAVNYPGVRILPGYAG